MRNHAYIYSCTNAQKPVYHTVEPYISKQESNDHWPHWPAKLETLKDLEKTSGRHEWDCTLWCISKCCIEYMHMCAHMISNKHAVKQQWKDANIKIEWAWGSDQNAADGRKPTAGSSKSSTAVDYVHERVYHKFCRQGCVPNQWRHSIEYPGQTQLSNLSRSNP